MLLMENLLRVRAGEMIMVEWGEEGLRESFVWWVKLKYSGLYTHNRRRRKQLFGVSCVMCPAQKHPSTTNIGIGNYSTATIMIQSGVSAYPSEVGRLKRRYIYNSETTLLLLIDLNIWSFGSAYK